MGGRLANGLDNGRMKNEIDYKTKSLILRPDNDKSWKTAMDYLTKYDKENLGLVITHLGTLRTYSQNASIHLYCKWLAVAFNEAGLLRTKRYRISEKFFSGIVNKFIRFIKGESEEDDLMLIEMPWTMESVKEDMWHPIQYAMFPYAVKESGEPSTAKLNTAQVSQVYDVISMNVAQSKGVSVPFPDKYGNWQDNY